MRIMIKNSKKATLKAFLNPVTLATSLVLIIGMVLIGLVVIFWGRDPASTLPGTPEVTVIPAPTLTPRRADPTQSPSATPTSIFTIPGGAMGVGSYVQVTGTQGAGLRMRSEPGLGSKVKFTALDSEAFLIIDGPIEADGYIWWLLEAPYDQNRTGWSAGDFLTTIEAEDD